MPRNRSWLARREWSAHRRRRPACSRAPATKRNANDISCLVSLCPPASVAHPPHSCEMEKCQWPQSRTRKFEQVDKWSFCLTTAIIAANRRDHEQTTAPEPHTGLQDEGGACRRQARSDDSTTGRAL